MTNTGPMVQTYLSYTKMPFTVLINSYLPYIALSRLSELLPVPV